MRKEIIAACSCLMAFAGIVYADAWDKKTEVTLDQPVIVAGVPVVTLEPGTYVIRLLNSSADRHIVQIFNKGEDRLFTTILAIPNYRLTPKDKSAFAFYETPSGNPPALHAWFYPGDNFGQEFVYPKGLAAKIVAQTGGKVLATPVETVPELAEAPVIEVTPPAETPANEIATAAPAPAFEPPLAPAPAPEPEPLQLPATASPLFIWAWVGAFMLVGGIGLHKAARL